MHLSYFPIENHKSEYFCEICEDEMNPHSCFYHCHECVQSVHSSCAPVMLCCETQTYSESHKNIYKFINVKFGSIHKTDDHPHPLSFAQGILSDGNCSVCGKRLWYEMILKCLECQFSVHALKNFCGREQWRNLFNPGGFRLRPPPPNLVKAVALMVSKTKRVDE
ncbi:hypothetical protein HanPI659440_Chr10g0389391 [Helianthus annuus]|nr:hypothetical protein HanPI659440_Chr10g0389391 [Helianthus annuus]